MLGKHGNPSHAIISRELMRLEDIPFYAYRFSSTEKAAGKTYQQVLTRPNLDPDHAKIVIFGIDTGYYDPTLIQIFGYDNKGSWRVLARYRLTRISFPEQAEIINWLVEYYKPGFIGIDLGPGGGGIGIMQDLQTRFADKGIRYDKIIQGIRFQDAVVMGQDANSNDLKVNAKQYGAQTLAKMVEQGELILSQLDQEGISQLERVAVQRRADGAASYFVQSEKTTGVSTDDHIFASYIVFVCLLLYVDLSQKVKRQKLFSARWL